MAIERTLHLDTNFIIERYHRAFDDELAVIRSVVRLMRGAARHLVCALQQLEGRLKMHALLQEMRLFPAFAANAPRDPSLLEAHATDALKLFCAVDAVRSASRDLESPALRSRVDHLVDEIQDHLTLEGSMLASWTLGRPPVAPGENEQGEGSFAPADVAGGIVARVLYDEPAAALSHREW